MYRYVMKISDRQPKISDSLKISDFSDSLQTVPRPAITFTVFAPNFCLLSEVRGCERLVRTAAACPDQEVKPSLASTATGDSDVTRGDMGACPPVVARN